ncbi:DUF2163 domain-containing protein [Shimia sp.]|uniref:DUF2163 domain-containing protein n=1 Tax=Shimia sp. TaxID=1954381 RepID=UPI003B8B1A5E
MGMQPELLAHLQTGTTTVARAWGIERCDGVRLGFTDHDNDLEFERFSFRAASGLTTSALEQSTGLSVDNAEAIGVLSDASVQEADIAAGRMDGADITAWLVNWVNPDERSVLFRGNIGEIRRSGGAFVAELRGLAEQLNVPRGRVYQRPCSAVLGDASCRFDLNAPGYVHTREVADVSERRVFHFPTLDDYEPGWFTRGQLQVQSGIAEGLSGLIKRDWFDQDGGRNIELWEPLGAQIGRGDQVKLVAGCDKRFSTCRHKFLNTLNFQGFPDIPGEDWITSYPTRESGNTGGSLR